MEEGAQQTPIPGWTIPALSQPPAARANIQKSQIHPFFNGKCIFSLFFFQSGSTKPSSPSFWDQGESIQENIPWRKEPNQPRSLDGQGSTTSQFRPCPSHLLLWQTSKNPKSINFSMENVFFCWVFFFFSSP